MQSDVTIPHFCSLMWQVIVYLKDTPSSTQFYTGLSMLSVFENRPLFSREITDCDRSCCWNRYHLTNHHTPGHHPLHEVRYIRSLSLSSLTLISPVTSLSLFSPPEERSHPEMHLDWEEGQTPRRRWDTGSHVTNPWFTKTVEIPWGNTSNHMWNFICFFSKWLYLFL